MLLTFHACWVLIQWFYIITKFYCLPINFWEIKKIATNPPSNALQMLWSQSWNIANHGFLKFGKGFGFQGKGRLLGTGLCVCSLVGTLKFNCGVFKDNVRPGWQHNDPEKPHWLECLQLPTCSLFVVTANTKYSQSSNNFCRIIYAL